MNGLAGAIFGARAQVSVGGIFVAATLFQGWFWGVHGQPSTSAIFWLSIEALLFASYAVVATGLGYRATERVEQVVVEQADDVDIEVEP